MDMIELGVCMDAATCLVVSFAISFWVGRRYQKFWPKFVAFFIASAIGITLFPLISGIWQGAAPRQEHLIDAASRKQFWVIIGGVVAMAYFGAWRMQKVVDENRRG